MEAVTVFLKVALAEVASLAVANARSPLSSGNQMVLSDAGGAVRSVLEASVMPYSSVLLFTDGDTSAHTVYKAMREIVVAPFGVGVMEVETSGGENETLHHHVASVVRLARSFRDMVWLLTVVVVSDDPAFLSAFAEVADEERLLVWSTRVLVVSNLDLGDLARLLASYRAFATMNVMAVTPEEEEEGMTPGALRPRGIVLHLPHSPGGSKTTRVATWTPSGGLVYHSSLLLFPQKYDNFYGGPVTVAVLHAPPYWIETEETSPEGATVKRFSGRDWLLLVSVARALNFTISHLPCKDWAEAMDRIKDRSALISPAVYVVMRHLLATRDYTVSIEPDTLTFSMAAPSHAPSWVSIYYPFTFTVWLLILMVLVLVPGSLLVLSRTGEVVPEATAEGASVNTWRGSILQATFRAVQETTGTLLGQGLSRKLPSSTPFRILLGVWLVFGLVVSTAYRGNLTAFLTVPKYSPRAETLHQLIESGARATVPMDDGVDLIKFFGNSGSRDFQILSRRVYMVPDTMKGLRQAMERKEAYLYIRKFLEAMIAQYFTDKNGRSGLYVARENISPGFAAWPIIRDAPFKQPLDRCLVALVEAGLSEKWMNDMLDDAKRASRMRDRVTLQHPDAMKDATFQEQEDLRPLSLTHILGPLVCLVLGLLLSLASFMLEMLVAFVVTTS
ncbi:ionotropic receptor 21a-like [Procambarus clarkii]|uniref:ionotropic receptor 21a-like n=1 Tax=Procambarus clarkii TaxID=6728 RepID=UPI0037445089